MAKCIMVQGIPSGADKRLPAAAPCRISPPNGWRAAPFVCRNVALNSAISRGWRAAIRNDALLRAIKEVF